MVLSPHEGSRESGGGARPPSMATNHKISPGEERRVVGVGYEC